MLLNVTRFTEALDNARNNGLKTRYGNFIGGKFVDPVQGRYFTDHSPINGEKLADIARSSPEDVELALDAAHAAKKAWRHTSPTVRADLLIEVSDRIKQNLNLLAAVETIDNGKPIRETINADIPLAADHFRYFAGCLRAEEGSIAEIDDDTVAYHYKEPLGVVAQIIPWNFPLLMAAWKMAPAIAAGNCVVIKPASETPLSLLLFASLIADVLPPGVLNVLPAAALKSAERSRPTHASRRSRSPARPPPAE
jgi:aldehyde dehydrogenase